MGVGEGMGADGHMLDFSVPRRPQPTRHSEGRTLKSGHVNVENAFTKFPIPEISY